MTKKKSVHPKVEKPKTTVKLSLNRAYESLGYDLKRVLPMRPNWSAEKEDGVCLSLWYADLKDPTYFDTRTDAVDSAIWQHTFQNDARVFHLQKAIAEFGSCVDVVMLEGKNSKIKAAVIDDACKRGRISDFDPETGHFKLTFLSQEAGHAG